jgi:hypothetical protein
MELNAPIITKTKLVKTNFLIIASLLIAPVKVSWLVAPLAPLPTMAPT